MSTIAEYKPSEAALSELRARMKDVVYEVTTTQGMEMARKDRRELITLRTTLEAERKRIKAPALQRCKEIDTEATRITGEILKLEQPIDSAIKTEEQRIEAIREAKRQAELQRIAAITQKIDAIRNLPVTAVTKNTEDLQLTIDRLTAYGIDESFQEFQEAASCLKSEVMVTLQNILNEKVRAAEEAARLQAEKEEQERAAALEAERLAAERAAFEEEKRIQKEKEDAAWLEAAAKLAAEKEAAEKELAVARLAQLEELAERQKEIDAENVKERIKIAAEREAQVAESQRIATEQKKAEDAKAEAERLQKEKVEAEKLEADKKRAEKAAGKVVEPLDLIKSVYALLCHEKKTDTQKVEVSKVMLGTYLKQKEQGNGE